MLIRQHRRFRFGGRELEVALQFAQRELPSVALIRHEPLKDREIAPFRTPDLVVDPSGEWRRMRKTCGLGQEATEFDIGIKARLEFAEHLENEAVAKHDRGVALLGFQDAGFRNVTGAIKLTER